jgi:two-component system sensor histidine kinase/response regulator
VDSTPGKGSVFSFHAEFEKGTPEITALPTLIKPHVLVVSDSATTRFLLGESLTDAGIAFRTAWHHDAALALVQGASLNGNPFTSAVVDRPSTAAEIERLAHAIGDRPGSVVAFHSLGEPIEGLGGATSVTMCSKPMKQRRLFRLLTSAPGTGGSLADETELPAISLPAGRSDIRILLAEDNSVNQKVALGVLRNLGHGATVAANGEQVLAALEVGTYDLIFMDCQMPVMDGFEATRRIRALAIKQPTIIAMTANALPGDRERCLVAGMNDYITKPIRAEILAEKIAALKQAA